MEQRTEGSALRRAGYAGWLRNIAVALGNAPHLAPDSSPHWKRAASTRSNWYASMWPGRWHGMQQPPSRRTDSASTSWLSMQACTAEVCGNQNHQVPVDVLRRTEIIRHCGWKNSRAGSRGHQRGLAMRFQHRIVARTSAQTLARTR